MNHNHVFSSCSVSIFFSSWLVSVSVHVGSLIVERGLVNCRKRKHLIIHKQNKMGINLLAVGCASTQKKPRHCLHVAGLFYFLAVCLVTSLGKHIYRLMYRWARQYVTMGWFFMMLIIFLPLVECKRQNKVWTWHEKARNKRNKKNPQKMLLVAGND